MREQARVLQEMVSERSFDGVALFQALVVARWTSIRNSRSRVVFQASDVDRTYNGSGEAGYAMFSCLVRERRSMPLRECDATNEAVPA